MPTVSAYVTLKACLSRYLYQVLRLYSHPLCSSSRVSPSAEFLVCTAVYNQTYRQGSSANSGTIVPATLVGAIDENRIKAALAGFVLLSISNVLLLAVLGTRPTETNTYNNREVVSNRGAQMTTQPAPAYPTSAATPAHAGMTGVTHPGVGAGQTVV